MVDYDCQEPHTTTSAIRQSQWSAPHDRKQLARFLGKDTDRITGTLNWNSINELIQSIAGFEKPEIEASEESRDIQTFFETAQLNSTDLLKLKLMINMLKTQYPRDYLLRLTENLLNRKQKETKKD